MALTRAELLARAGLAAGAAAAGRVDVAEAAPDLHDWAAVRGQFALDRRRIQLSSFLLASHPRPVAAAIERHRRALDADPAGYLHGNEARLTGAAREAAGRFLGVPTGAVAL